MIWKIATELPQPAIHLDGLVSLVHLATERSTNAGRSIAVRAVFAYRDQLTALCMSVYTSWELPMAWPLSEILPAPVTLLVI
jgi:hypothetical protein